MNIWKFPLEVRDRQSVEMPFGARSLTVQVQNEIPCLWALVEPSNTPQQRTIRIVGTGHDFDGNGEYIGTFQLAAGALVFHVFESLP